MMMMGESAERIENMDLRSGKCYLNQHVYVGKAGARSNLHCLGEGLGGFCRSRITCTYLCFTLVLDVVSRLGECMGVFSLTLCFTTLGCVCVVQHCSVPMEKFFF